MAWREAQPTDRGPQLVNSHVRIWWDDESGGKFYSGLVLGYNMYEDTFSVRYDESQPGEQSVFDEALKEEWQIWDGPGAPPEALAYLPRPPSMAFAQPMGQPMGMGMGMQPSMLPGMGFGLGFGGGGGEAHVPAYPKRPSSQPIPLHMTFKPPPKLLNVSRATYSEMVAQGLETFGDKGASLVGMRKWIQQYYPETARKHKASFNALTKKAVAKLVAEGIAIKVRGTFRMNPEYLYRRGIELDGGKEQPLGGPVRADALLAGDRRSRDCRGENEIVLSHNRELREELQAAQNRRDQFLLRHKAFFLPFLDEERNYFTDKRREARNRCAEVARVRTEEHRRGLMMKAREQEALMVSKIEEERLKDLHPVAKRFADEMAGVRRAQQQHMHFQQQQLYQQHYGYVAAPSMGMQQHYPPHVQHDPMYAHAHFHRPDNGSNGPRPPTDPSNFNSPAPSLDPSLSLMGGGGMPRPLSNGKAGPTPSEQPQWSLEFYDFPFDGGPEYVALLLEAGLIADGDRGGAHPSPSPSSSTRLGITGKPLDPATLLPPLEMDASGQLTMDDAALIGTTIADGPFAEHVVVWPGSRLQLDHLPTQSDKDAWHRLVEWRHVYWLRNPKTDVPPPRRNANVLALRLRSGGWVGHKFSLLRTTQRFAETKKIPADNLATIRHLHPLTGQWAVAQRDYCEVHRYGEAARRWLKSCKDPARLQPLFDRYKPLSPPVADPAHPPAAQQESTFSLSPSLSPSPSPPPPSLPPAPLPPPAYPPHLPPIDPMAAERCRWITLAMRRTKLSSLDEAARQYDYLLAEGARMPPELLAPITTARDASRQWAITLSKQVNEARSAEPPPQEEPAYLQAALGKEEEEGANAKAKAAPLRPIDPMAGVAPITPSRSVTVPPHKHQVEGLSWLVHMYKTHMPAILGDQMGLGKTFQAIAMLAYLKDNLNVKGPHLVVVPLSVLSNWMIEFERFCPSMRCVRFHGPKVERTRIKHEELGDMKEFDVVITTYEILVSEANWFRRKFVWRVLIVDEGHRLKNEKSQLSECLRRVPAFYRLLLTGTPTQNNLRELWALFHYLLGDVFPSNTAETFAESFDAGRNVMDMDKLRASRALLSLVMLRRRKEHISMQLPSKTELAVMCGLSDIQKGWYKRVLTGIGESLLTGDKAAMGENDWRKLLNLLLQLRKVCNHPYLMSNALYTPGEELVESSGKLKVLDRMLPRLREDGHRVLLFSQFTSMLDILEDFCMMRGFEYCRLDGSTNRVQRRLDIRRFNAAGSPLFIFLISTRAGGQGINLASADTVILYDSDWNPQVDLQAMERCHRIGQSKPVRVYRLVVRKSVEERMVSRAHKKLFLNEMVAEKPSGAEAEGLDALEDGLEEEEGEEGEGAPVVEEDVPTEMSLLRTENVNTKDEVARMIRSGVTALFETGKTEVTDEEIDILLGRKEGTVDNTLTEADDEKTHRLWQAKDDMSLQDVDVRQFDGVTYNKAEDWTKGKGPEKGGVDLNDLVSGTRKRKQRTVMVDGKGSGYGSSVPVLASEMLQEEEAGEAKEKAAPKRLRRDWDNEKDCFLCASAVQPRKAPKPWVKCGWCPHVFHVKCLHDYTGEPVDGTTTVVCPQHKCCMCNRNTASAGGLLFRCVDCPHAYCEDCLEDELCESLGRWKPMEQLNYITKMAYWIRCQECVRALRGDVAEEGEEEGEEEGLEGGGEEEEEQEEGEEEEEEEK